MLYREHFNLKSLFKYWRNTLADEDLMSLSSENCPVTCEPTALRTHSLDSQSIKKLQTAWQNHKKRAIKNQTKADIEAEEEIDSIPIIILAKGFAPKREHGQVLSHKASARSYYTLHIPAILNPDGQFSVIENNTPWIGREFLSPNIVEDENIPIVGELEKFDHWLNQHPLENVSWEDYLDWCNQLWEEVIGNEVPEGFASLRDIRIDISMSVKNASKNISQLYNALNIEDKIPPLLERICHGFDNPIKIDIFRQLGQVDAIRGTMSTEYGLAKSQSDAVTAYTLMEDGDVLAVNGPPGTGKTTLLQSIIATEIVSRAIAGEEPAVIVGSSMNNQPIQNINADLNKILSQNPAQSLFPWAARWVPDADSYGLYFPSGERKKEALKNGFKIVEKTDRDWLGFPEREADEDYLTSAKTYWLDNFTKTYDSTPETIQDGINKLQSDLKSHHQNITKIKTGIIKYYSIKHWWKNKAGDLTQQDFIAQEKTKWSNKVKTAHENLDHKKAELENLEQQQSNCVNNLSNIESSIDNLNITHQSTNQNLLAIKSKVTEALTPHGILELIASVISLFKSLLIGRQQARLLALAAENAEANTIFHEQLNWVEPDGWSLRIDEFIQQTKNEQLAERHKLLTILDEASQNVILIKKKVMAAADNRLDAEKKLTATKIAKRKELEYLEQKAAERETKETRYFDSFFKLREDALTEFQVAEKLINKLKESPSLENLDDSQSLHQFNILLDVTWRHMMFQKAMRYWEGRWLIECDALQAGDLNVKSGLAGMESRFRRWCMLTPCLVITAHSLPKFFRYKSNIGGDNPWITTFMFNFIDLLIMDESGQIGPHVGTSAFALAKRAVIVGDIHQIEPISKLTPGTDYANLASTGLQSLWKNGNPATPHLVSEPKNGSPMGSVIRLAQEATMAVSADIQISEPGIFLSEHRRCRKEIINYCKALIYKRLEILTDKRDKTPPLPPMAWAHVRGEETKVGRSRANRREAESIAEWIVKQTDDWCEHYDKPIHEIVAIITPFRPQTQLIRASLHKHGSQYSKVVIGTIHSLQGAEKPIVIFSPTYNTDTSRSAFFNRKPYMLNVAVSRAKDSFVVIGDMRLFRNPGNSPSSLLGKHLFLEEVNELVDVEGNHRFSTEQLAQAERVSNLEFHRSILKDILLKCNSNELVVIASPWITLKAVQQDNLCKLIFDAVRGRSAQIHVIVDEELSTQRPYYRADEALEALEQSGASISKVQKMHCKSLIYSTNEIIEGSFNWLSSPRSGNQARHEVSWRIIGTVANSAIKQALKEFSQLGAPLQYE